MTAATARRDRDDGFTLIELLVVIIIIAVLSAIAIPQFMKQREKAMRANATADMKNAATAVETLATQYEGSYIAADGLTEESAELQDEGFNPSLWVNLTVEATVGDYCIRGVYTEIPDQEFVFRSTTGLVDVDDVGTIPCA